MQHQLRIPLHSTYRDLRYRQGIKTEISAIMSSGPCYSSRKQNCTKIHIMSIGWYVFKEITAMQNDFPQTITVLIV